MSREPFLSLSTLLHSVKEVLDEAFGYQECKVLAEVSDLKYYAQSGHRYLTLIEKKGGRITAKAEAVIWQSASDAVDDFEKVTGIAFAQGIEVMMNIQVTYHVAYGFKLNITGIDPAYTLGKIEQEKQATLEALVKNNPSIISYFDGEYKTANHRLLLSPVIQRIAVISAPHSDGLRDFLQELKTNSYGYTFQVDEYLCTIQGIGSEVQIAEKMKAIIASKVKYDAVAILRGGGGNTDFSNFDTYVLGFHTASYPIPVLTGIGHDRNVSITDMMAHKSLKTPTKVAAFIIEQNLTYESSIIGIWEKIKNSAAERLYVEKDRINGYDILIRQSVISLFKTERYKLDGLEGKLKLLDPKNVLKRGYSYLMKEGNLINTVEKVKKGEGVTIILYDGSLSAQITNKSS